MAFPPFLVLLRVVYIALTTLASSVVEYWWQGPRLPKWSLMYQVKTDIAYQVLKNGRPRLQNDEGIENIAMLDIARILRTYAFTPVPLNKAQGTCQPFDIPVKQVRIDKGKLGDVGVGTERLSTLCDSDMASTSERVLPCEMVVATQTANAIAARHASGKDERPFGCEPLHPDEKIVLYFHGGAYIIGSHSSHRQLTCRISAAANARVVSVDYRLAPEHPFPAQVHDALIAFRYLVQRGFRPENIVVAGDSAGGHLSLSLTHLLRQMTEAPPGGVVLLSPLADMVDSRLSHRHNQRYDFLDLLPITSPMAYGRIFYAPGQPLTEKMRMGLADPLVSPINADYAQFPPTLIQAGGKEVMIDDIAALHRAMLAGQVSGGRVQLEEYEDMGHIFHMLASDDEAAPAYASIGRFIQQL